MFLDTFVLKEIGRFHFSWHFCIQRIWSFLVFKDTFRNQKCLETVKRQNPLKYSKNLVKPSVSGHFPYSKVSRKSKVKVMKGFFPFPKSKAQTEPSAAGARRGVYNCIRTTIPLGPPAEGRPGPSDDDDDDGDGDDGGMVVPWCALSSISSWEQATARVKPLH